MSCSQDVLPDYELLELLLFSAVPRRDTKPMAKLLLQRFGSFAEVINAPAERASCPSWRGRFRNAGGILPRAKDPATDRNR